MNQTIIQTTENESYIQSTFNGLENEQIFNVLFRKSDGYINVTKLCKDGNKNYFNWKKSNHSTKLLQAFQKKYPDTELLQLVNGGRNYKISGTYAHPDMVSHIASWISEEFAVMISFIIQEWRNISTKNEDKYWNTMGNCIINYPSENNDSEEEKWRDKIASEENGQIEIKEERGIIDVLTDTKVIEVKKVENWKHALGQVIAYSVDTKKEPWIYLFGDTDEEQRNMIRKHCSIVNVRFL